MSLSKLDSHLKLALASIPVFTDDGRMDLAELDRLLAVALEDQVVDPEEKRVLANVLARAEKDGVDAEVQARIGEVRQLHGL
ncbi:hypothetical protein [Lysobacter sp. M2-1]|jgi:hypothetical protein|uniref:hypothetical protein n=1 Tax=Lysobacter sp. M2-1 TaxID=2916839 RepID=UPI001F590BF5|nr:hypothetical protein [Lysobacter sp. M2-1]